MSDRLRILCFGNDLHGDDGFGPALGAALRRRGPPADVAIVDCGIRGLDAVQFFSDCAEVVVVDALLGSQPGRLHDLPADAVPPEAGRGHGSGLGDLLRSLPVLLERLPAIRVLAAETAACTPFRPGLSPALAAAVETAAARLAARWEG